MSERRLPTIRALPELQLRITRRAAYVFLGTSPTRADARIARVKVDLAPEQAEIG